MALFDKIGEFAKSAGEKAGDKIETTKLRAKIHGEQQAITGFQGELGARYWEKITSGEMEVDPLVSDIIDKIRASYTAIEGFEADIRKIEEERAAAEAAAKAAAEAAAAEAAAAKAAAAGAAAAQPYAAQPCAAQPYAAQPCAAQPYAAQSCAAQQDTAPAESQVQEAPAVPAEKDLGGIPVQGEYTFGAPAQPPVQQPPVQQPPQPAQQPAGSACANCGATLNAGAKFCRECGTPAPAPAPAPAAPVKRFCANCGHELALGTRFCAECGTKA